MPNPRDTDSILEHTGFLRNLARSLVFDDGQADDVVQDALMVALRERPQRRSKLRAWLAGITRNLALKSLRSDGRRVRRERAVARAESLTGTSEVAARLELHRMVVEAVQALAEPYRTTVVHRYFDGCSVKEITRLMDTPVGCGGRSSASASSSIRCAPAIAGRGVSAWLPWSPSRAPSPWPAPRARRRRFQEL